MNRRTFLQATTAAAAFLALPGCGHSLPTFRYRWTVEVDTPEGLRSGSSVIQVEAAVAGKLNLPSANGLAVDVRGEAVTVDLGKRGLLFALLRSDNSPNWAGSAFEYVTPHPANDREHPERSGYEAWHTQMIANKGVHAIPHFRPVENQWQTPNTPDRNQWPMLVTFKDIADPKTVTKVDPDHLEASFGPGVKLRRITVEVTEDAVTTGIEKRLGWLPNVYSMKLDSDFHPAGIPVGDFKRLFSTELGQ